jgi:hypothetical protein
MSDWERFSLVGAFYILERCESEYSQSRGVRLCSITYAKLKFSRENTTYCRTKTFILVVCLAAQMIIISWMIKNTWTVTRILVGIRTMSFVGNLTRFSFPVELV